MSAPRWQQPLSVDSANVVNSGSHGLIDMGACLCDSIGISYFLGRIERGLGLRRFAKREILVDLDHDTTAEPRKGLRNKSN
jgi:hypothetical protein